MIIIPEMFNKTQITIDKIVRLIISSMIKRRIVGQKFGVVVVGEGIFIFYRMKILLLPESLSIMTLTDILNCRK